MAGQPHRRPPHGPHRHRLSHPRYYGYLDTDSLRAVLTHCGDIHTLGTSYRGWGLLPWAAQMLEKHLLLTHGWNWLTYSVSAQVLEHDDDETFNRVELVYQTPDGESQTVQADVVADAARTVYLKGSCASDSPSAITPYRVENVVQYWGEMVGVGVNR